MFAYRKICSALFPALPSHSLTVRAPKEGRAPEVNSCLLPRFRRTKCAAFIFAHAKRALAVRNIKDSTSAEIRWRTPTASVSDPQPKRVRKLKKSIDKKGIMI